MKRLVLAAVLTVFCLTLAACGGKDPVSGYKSGDVTLGQYKGITYTAESVDVTDAEVDQYIKDYFLSQHKVAVPVEDRDTVEYGDIVNIDYYGFMDGVQFDGGSASGFDLTIGSGQFIDGFENGLIGHAVGENVELNLTFPDPYETNPDYAGQPVMFLVDINSISVEELPEFTDELVEAYSEYSTVAEYTSETRSLLVSEKEAAAESSMNYQVVKQLIANTTFNADLAELIYKGRENLRTSYDSMYNSYYGFDGASFYSYIYGMNVDEYEDYLEAQAKISVEYSMILSAIVEKEGITVTDEEIEVKAEEMMESYNLGSVDALYETLRTNYKTSGKEIVRIQAAMDKAASLVYDSAIAQ